jgi:hypothetical protein
LPGKHILGGLIRIDVVEVAAAGGKQTGEEPTAERKASLEFLLKQTHIIQ